MKQLLFGGSLLAILWLPVGAQMPFPLGERQYAYSPQDVLPAASTFVRKDGYWEGYTEEGGRAPAGYVLLSDDLVQVPGYSGHSLNTLIGFDPEGKITGVKLVRHAEPIVLLGIPEEALHRFLQQYQGKAITDRFLISEKHRPGYQPIDAISGATVTAVAANATLIQATRLAGQRAGLLESTQVRAAGFSQEFAPLDWPALAERGAFGSLTVRPADLGLAGEEPLIELYFAVANPPLIGRNLLGERFYRVIEEKAQGGRAALFIAARGSTSFKGAGFARGGIFDRFSVEQDGQIYVFKDIDYLNFPHPEIEGAPELSEGGLFILGGDFDPTRPFSLHLTVPYRIDDQRQFETFVVKYALPDELLEREVAFWVNRWQAQGLAAAAFGVFLVAGFLFFALRRRLHPYRRMLHYTMAVVAFAGAGLALKAQPSTTQLLTLAHSLKEGRFPAEVFLSEPAIFLFWIAIALSLPLWGRGFFCGWLCPYGALLEVLIALRNRLLPHPWRQKLDAWTPSRFWQLGKYLTFLVLVALALVNLPLAEVAAEIEPFKTLILHWVRPSYFVGYFVVVTLLSLVGYRLFCRFLCPLGGALALPTGRPLFPLLRYQQCATCKICYQGCEPRAISYRSGKIDYRECLQCWSCQAKAHDPGVCPELIGAAREGRAPRVVTGALALLVLAGTSVPAKTWVAGEQFARVQDAIGASAPGDTVLVRPGVYHEHLEVDHPLTVLGEGEAVIDAGGQGHVVHITAPQVVVAGLVLRRGGADLSRSDAGIRAEQQAADVLLRDNRIEDCLFGIWIHGSPGARVVGNQVAGRAALDYNSRGNGIHLWNAVGAEVRGNRLHHTRDGIYMELSHDSRIEGNTVQHSRYAFHTMWCDRNVFADNLAAENLVGTAMMFCKGLQLTGNIAHNNAAHGLLLIQITRSRVQGNLLIGNAKGCFVYNSLYDTLQANLILGNDMGVHYWAGSEENLITGNAFFQNRIQVKFVASRDQIWEGNYWSDYTGWDRDRDGRGETPYRSHLLVDALLWNYPAAKFLLASPALQLLALSESAFPVITVPKAVDPRPLMAVSGLEEVLVRYPPRPKNYYGAQEKLPHIPGER